MKTSFKIIKFLLGEKFFERKLEKLKKIDPDRFFVENIRAYFNMTYFAAQRLCDEAVQDGKFDKKIGLQCPNCDRIITSFDSNNAISEDKIIVCDICAGLEKEVYEFKASKLTRIDIYSLHRA